MKVVLFEMLKSNWSQTWLMDGILEPSYFMRSKVTYQGQWSSDWSSNWNQTWFIGIIWEHSYVHAVKGHKSKPKVI